MESAAGPVQVASVKIPWPTKQCVARRAWRRLLMVVASLALSYFYTHHRQYHSALQAKYQPTRFADHAVFHDGARWRLDANGTAAARRRLWSERDEWTPLAEGYEGATFVHGGRVIKSFNVATSPLRNCVPNTSPSQRWPTEIPASLLLGGLHDDDGAGAALPDEADFVPIYDYFLSPATPGQPASWHLVTPFLQAGDLARLAGRLRRQHLSSHRELDARFRPSLHRLLAALDAMHTRHGLCHDDIKLANIFASNFSTPQPDASDAHWLFADLGNARHVSHAYHASRLWRVDSGQNADCRANDAVRLVKAYTQFLQLASSDEAPSGDRSPPKPFAAALFDAEEPWARFYWATVGREQEAAAAAEAGAASHTTFDAATALALSWANAPLSPVAGEDGGRDDGSSSRGVAVDLRRTVYEGAAQPTALGHRGRAGGVAVQRELKRGMTANELKARLFNVGAVPMSAC